MKLTRNQSVHIIALSDMINLTPEKREEIVIELFMENDEYENIKDFSDATYNDDITLFIEEKYQNVSNDYIAVKLKNIFDSEFEIIGNPQIYNRCFCCGYLTIKTRGEYDICPVCFWEDDGSEDTERFSQANKMKLSEGISNFKKYGYSNPAFRDNVTIEKNKYLNAQ